MTTAEKLRAAGKTGLISMGGASSISGSNDGVSYCASQFADGSACLMVGGEVIDYSNEPVTYSVLEAWALAARCLTQFSQEERAANILKHHGDVESVSIDGVIWSKDGSYIGLNWRS